MKRVFWAGLWLLCLVLAACGGSSTAASPAPRVNAASGGGTSAPAPTNGPTVLHVTRTDPSPTDNLGPLDKTVTSVQTVQNLYRMALALPAYPVEMGISQSCLNDTGVIYHLDFLRGDTEVQRMNLDPGNCRVLYLSQSDLRRASDTFLNILKQALQLSSLTAN